MEHSDSAVSTGRSCEGLDAESLNAISQKTDEENMLLFGVNLQWTGSGLNMIGNRKKTVVGNR